MFTTCCHKFRIEEIYVLTAGYRAVLAKRTPLLAWHVTPLDRSSSSWDRLILPLNPPAGAQSPMQILVCMEARAWNLERPH